MVSGMHTITPEEKKLIAKLRVGEYRELPLGQDEFQTALSEKQRLDITRIIPRPT